MLLLNFNSVFGDGLTCMRLEASKNWRCSEEEPADRLEYIVPGIGLFHAIWDYGKEILSIWWGSMDNFGSISKGNQFLGGHVSMDGKKFNLLDDFLFTWCDILCVATFGEIVGEIEEENAEEKINTYLKEFLFSRNLKGKKEYVRSQLFAILIYCEVKIQLISMFLKTKSDTNIILAS